MVSKKEIAKHFGVSIPTVDRWIKAGVPHYKIGKLVRFEIEEVKEWFRNESTDDTQRKDCRG